MNILSDYLGKFARLQSHFIIAFARHLHQNEISSIRIEEVTRDGGNHPTTKITFRNLLNQKFVTTACQSEIVLEEGTSISFQTVPEILVLK